MHNFTWSVIQNPVYEIIKKSVYYDGALSIWAAGQSLSEGLLAVSTVWQLPCDIKHTWWVNPISNDHCVRYSPNLGGGTSHLTVHRDVGYQRHSSANFLNNKISCCRLDIDTWTNLKGRNVDMLSGNVNLLTLLFNQKRLLHHVEKWITARSLRILSAKIQITST